MLIPARFVALDDNFVHLKLIVDAFDQTGTSCLGRQYSAEVDPDSEVFSSARVIFMDLHLMSNVPSTDSHVHFGEIWRLLELFRRGASSPYALVVWTEHAEQVAPLEKYLIEKASEAPGVLPLVVIAMSKSSYFDPQTSSRLPGTNIAADLQGILSKDPGLGALLRWEAELAAAGGVALATLSALSTGGVRELADGLRHLAEATAGRSALGSEPPRDLLVGSLMPLVVDAMSHGIADRGDVALWASAVKPSTEVPLTPADAARLNAAFHLQFPSTPNAALAVWGAVVETPENFDWTPYGPKNAADAKGQLLAAAFGMSQPEMSEKFKVQSLVQIRVDAACDYAQGKRPHPVVLGGLIGIGKDDKGNEVDPVLSPKSTAWISPALQRGDGPRQWLVAVPRWLSTHGAPDAPSGTRLFRLREQLLLQLIGAIAHNMQRPGIAESRTR